MYITLFVITTAGINIKTVLISIKFFINACDLFCKSRQHIKNLTNFDF